MESYNKTISVIYSNKSYQSNSLYADHYAFIHKNVHKNFCDIVIMLIWYKISHKFFHKDNIEHDSYMKYKSTAA